MIFESIFAVHTVNTTNHLSFLLRWLCIILDIWCHIWTDMDEHIFLMCNRKKKKWKLLRMNKYNVHW